MRFLRITSLVVLLVASFAAYSQTIQKPTVENELLGDACGTATMLTFPMFQNDKIPNFGKLKCDFATGPTLPAEIVNMLKSITSSTSLQPQKDLKCDLVTPFDDMMSLKDKMQQNSKDINDTFHR